MSNPIDLSTAYKIEVETGCWLWLRGTNKDGYGIYRINGKTINVYTVYYEKHKGKVPKGMELDHEVCSNRICVNPDHLVPKTHKENMRRSKNVKLNKEKAIEIKKLIEQKIDYKTIAKRYGVGTATIVRVKKGLWDA